MEKGKLLWVVALQIAVGCGPATGSRLGETEPVPFALEPAMVEGWRAVEGPSAYRPETLYEYLDGGAERYLTYGFRTLSHVRYEPEGDPSGGITIDVYDMGSVLGAFGMYRGGRPPRPEIEAWCAEGHRSGSVVAGWKDRYYVHGELDEQAPELIALAGLVMTRICGRISGSTEPPAVLGPLPADGLVPYSERWVADDLLGHAFLPGGVIAAYAVDSGQVRLFYSDLSSEVAAAEALARLRDHELAVQGLGDGVDSIGAGGFRFSAPGIGSGTVVRVGRFVVGADGSAPPEAREKLLTRLVEGLQARSWRR